jgi:hypothetical protein
LGAALKKGFLAESRAFERKIPFSVSGILLAETSSGGKMI